MKYTFGAVEAFEMAGEKAAFSKKGEVLPALQCGV
jgi:hypothetical protein